MIDIKELRRLAQAATPGPWYIGSGIYEGRNIYSAEAVTDDEGFTYNPVVATAEDDGVVCWDANARLIAAANPAVISELLDRLEAAEKERDALRAKVEEMDRQEPVAWMLNCQTLGGDTGWILSWTQSGAGLCNRLSGEENEKKLYTLPGAKGE